MKFTTGEKMSGYCINCMMYKVSTTRSVISGKNICSSCALYYENEKKARFIKNIESLQLVGDAELTDDFITNLHMVSDYYAKQIDSLYRKNLIKLTNENKHLKDKIQHLNKQYAKWRDNFCEVIALEILRRESEFEE
jgi:hypothetical protein